MPAADNSDPRDVGWAVAWERTIGWLSSEPVFAADGAIVSSGARFTRDGRFAGFLAAHVPGGRMLADVRALLADDRALVTTSEEGARLVVLPPGAPPERATARADVHVETLDIAAAGDRVAIHSGSEVAVLSLPALTELTRVSLAASVYDSGAVAITTTGLAYTAPASSCGDPCRELAVVVRDGDAERRLIDGGVSAVAFSDAGDAAAAWMKGGAIRVIALPSGALIGQTADSSLAASETTALAVADGGRALAALACTELRVFDLADADSSANAGSYREAFRGRLRDDDGRGDCAYLSGMRFAPGGDRLAIAARELTVLARGAATSGPSAPNAQAASLPRYQPALPPGFALSEDDTQGVFVYPSGTGLAPTPRRVATYLYDGDVWAEVRVVIRDATQFAGVAAGPRVLDAWADAVLLRFEPIARGEIDPNRVEPLERDVMPYRHAFMDEHGRRNLEYSIWQRGGCEPHDRYVRYVADGPYLIEITLDTQPGVDPKRVGPWTRQFFDVPLGAGAAKTRVLAKKLTFGGC